MTPAIPGVLHHPRARMGILPSVHSWGNAFLTLYFDYYHEVRPNLSLNCNSPTPRDVEQPYRGRVVSVPQVGGLHHRYRRAAWPWNKRPSEAQLLAVRQGRGLHFVFASKKLQLSKLHKPIRKLYQRMVGS